MMVEAFYSYLIKYLVDAYKSIFRGDVGFFPMMEERNLSEMGTSSSKLVKTFGKISPNLLLSEKVAWW